MKIIAGLQLAVYIFLILKINIAALLVGRTRKFTLLNNFAFSKIPALPDLTGKFN